MSARARNYSVQAGNEHLWSKKIGPGWEMSIRAQKDSVEVPVGFDVPSSNK